MNYLILIEFRNLTSCRCTAQPSNLDRPGARRRSQGKTDFLIKTFDPGILWDDYGVRADIVVCSTLLVPCPISSMVLIQPFTHDFPRADIHELLSPDLLHQVIKGVFKDHIVSWVNQYLHLVHGNVAALQVIDDIDRRCAN